MLERCITAKPFGTLVGLQCRLLDALLHCSAHSFKSDRSLDSLCEKSDGEKKAGGGICVTLSWCRGI